MSCEHLNHAAQRARSVRPSSHGCKECLEKGMKWVQLRLCLSCGHVGCCDSSPGQHATKHFHKTAHPVMRAYEPGADWAYCYPDEEFAQDFPALPGEEAAQHY